MIIFRYNFVECSRIRAIRDCLEGVGVTGRLLRGFPGWKRDAIFTQVRLYRIIIIGCRSPHPLWPPLIGLPRNSFPDTNHSTGPAKEAQAYQDRREAGLDFDVLGKKKNSRRG